MSLVFLPSTRFGRTASAVLAAAAFAVIGGCNDTGTTNGKTNSSAVTADGTTHMKDDAGSSDIMRAFPTGDKSSSVIMVEMMGPKTVRLQHEATYNVKVTNLTDMPVKAVTVSSTNPDGFMTTGVTGSTTQPSDMGMTYAVGDLGPKETKSFTVTGMATKVGSVDTCYSVKYNPPTLCTAMEVTNPAIALTVQAPADSDICKPVTYTYTVANTGTGTAHNVTLMEQLPDGLMTTDGKQMVQADLGDIPQGASRNATAMLKASKTGSFAGQAMAKADGDGTQPVATTTAFHAPALAVAVTGGASDYVTKPVAYQIVVTNKGDATATNAMVQIGHPTGGMGTVTAEGVDANGMVSLGDLAPNASKTINATATSATGGTVTVVANATANCSAPANGSAQTMFNTIPALLLETVDEADPVKVGSNVVYDVKVTNQGSGPDTNVNVKALIPDGEDYVSTDGATQPTVDGKNLTFPSIPTLQPKESVTWKITVKATKAQDVQFKTSATSDGVKAGAEKTEPTKLY